MTASVAERLSAKVQVVSEPWFVASDVAAVLGYRDAFNLTRRLDEEDRGTRSVSTPSGEQDMTVISESGLYVAVLGSQVQGAREFKRWVTREVLPQIRRTGSFNSALELDPMNNVQHLALIVQAGHAALTRALDAEAKVAELLPVAEAWTALADATGDYSLRDAAEVLCRDERIHTGQNLLLKYLREIGWVDRRGRPYQAQINTGRLAVRTRTYDNPVTGEPTITTQIRVTPKGVDAVHRLMTTPATELRALPGGLA